MKMSSLFHFHKQENTDMKKVLEKQDEQTNEIGKLKKAINNFWFEIPIKPDEQENFKVKTQEKGPESPKAHDSSSIRMPRFTEPSVVDMLTSPAHMARFMEPRLLCTCLQVHVFILGASLYRTAYVNSRSEQLRSVQCHCRGGCS